MSTKRVRNVRKFVGEDRKEKTGKTVKKTKKTAKIVERRTKRNASCRTKNEGREID